MSAAVRPRYGFSIVSQPRPEAAKSKIANLKSKIQKLGPCRAWAAGWLQGDPMGRCGLRSRIENRRNFEEKGGAGAARGFPNAITATKRELDSTGGRRGHRGKLLSADHADKRGLIASESATICEIRGKDPWSSCCRALDLQAKTGTSPLAHRRPSRATGSWADWTAAGFGGGRWLIDLGSAVKPHRNLGNELVGSDSGSGFKAVNEKPTSGWKVGRRLKFWVTF
jgi:hypothetical protein